MVSVRTKAFLCRAETEETGKRQPLFAGTHAADSCARSSRHSEGLTCTHLPHTDQTRVSENGHYERTSAPPMCKSQHRGFCALEGLISDLPAPVSPVEALVWVEHAASTAMSIEERRGSTHHTLSLRVGQREAATKDRGL